VLFCTLFDANYLARAIVLYRSLEATHPRFTLYLFCMDDPSAEYLEGLDLRHARIVRLQELEEFDRDLAAVKESRSRVEYYWTATPAVCLYSLEHEPAAEMVTYLDADLMFFADSRPVFDECPDASVLIVRHDFAPQWAHRTRADGVYNVQFNAFRRNQDGLRVLGWWRERCLEWCFARREDGRFGDQKYLDDWPERFPGVHVVEHPGAAVAPWNVPGRTFAQRGSRVYVDESPLLFYHHHGVAMYTDRRSVRLCRLARAATRAGLRTGHWHTAHPHPVGWWGHPAFGITRARDADRHRRLVWDPYWSALATAQAQLSGAGVPATAGTERLSLSGLLFWTAQGAIPSGARTVLRLARERLRTAAGTGAPTEAADG
jgi:hypothetical protein